MRVLKIIKMKNRKLNQWLWKWHFIAGLVSLPFVLVLSITGAIYLFKPNVEAPILQSIQKIKAEENRPLSYQKLWEIASKTLKKKPNSVVVSTDKNAATEFVSGRFSHKKSVFINPYNGKVSGSFSSKETWMHTVRKLHGELLGGKIGTKLVELIASWLVVLVITGLYIWWPFQRGIKGVFTIRFKEGKRTFFRDLHAVTGFWISGLLLLTLAGGFPWTDVFGSNFKTLQKITNTGYPKTWGGRGLTSVVKDKKLTLNEMVTIANKQNLKGIVSVGLPRSPKSTFSISNKTVDLNAQKMLHFDQYSGELIKQHNWSDVGFLMRGRMWVMAFHQGQFGGWNWWLMFTLSIVLTIMSVSAIISYLYRKPKDNWGIPKISNKFKLDKGIIALIILLGIIFPMFGFSLILILGYETFGKYFVRR